MHRNDAVTSTHRGFKGRVNKGVEVKTHEGFAGVFAARPIAKGDKVFQVTGEARPFPSRYSIQVDANLHIEPPDGGNGAPASMHASWRFLNHSCEPNLAVDFETWHLVAVRDVAAGEELSFNYLTTEWDMATPFQCGCGAHGCFRHIGGFKHLTPPERARLIGRAAPHIRRLVDEELRQRAPGAESPG